MTNQILTQEYLKELLNYCPKTGLFTWKIRPINKINIGDVAGCVGNTGYWLIRINYKDYRAHRIAFLFMIGRMPFDQVDHINHNRIDNRWSNLRECTNLENQRNASKRKDNKSGITGIDWNKNSNKWHARIRVQGNRIHLGLFEKLDNAIKARKSAEAKYGFHKNHGSII